METQLKPLLVAQNKGLAMEYKANWETVKKELQSLINRYNIFEFPDIENIDEVYKFLTDTEMFVYEKMTGGGAIVRGAHEKHLKVNAKAAMQLFDKPAGYDEVIKDIEAFKGKIIAGVGNIGSTARARFGISELRSYFTYEKGVLEFSEKQQQRINEAGNSYARTQRGQAVARFLQKVAKAYVEELSRGRDEVKSEEVGEVIQRALYAINGKTGEPRYMLGDTINPTFKADIG